MRVKQTVRAVVDMGTVTAVAVLLRTRAVVATSRSRLLCVADLFGSR